MKKAIALLLMLIIISLPLVGCAGGTADEFMLVLRSPGAARPVLTDRDFVLYFSGRHRELPSWETFITSGTAVLERSENGQWTEVAGCRVDLDFRGRSHGTLTSDAPFVAGDYRLRHTIRVEGRADVIELEAEFTVIPYETAPTPVWDVAYMSHWFDEWHRPQGSEKIHISIENPVLNRENAALAMRVAADGAFTYTAQYELVYIRDGNWLIVPLADYTCDDMEFSIQPGGENTHSYDLLTRVRVLPPGQYRIIKRFFPSGPDPNGPNFLYGMADFTVEEPLDWLSR